MMKIIIPFLAVAVFNTPVFSQNPLRFEALGQSGRPVAEVLDELERLSGIPIHYEDLRYEYAGDFEDISERVWNPENETPPEQRSRVLAPKVRPLSFTFGVDDEGLLPDAMAVELALNALSAAGSAADLPGRFEVERHNRDGRDDLFYLPTSMRGLDGAQRPHFGVLSTPISLSVNGMTAAQALGLILQGISEASGERIEVGMVPFGPLAWTKVSLNANNEAASQVLADLLSQLQGTSSIRMLLIVTFSVPMPT